MGWAFFPLDEELGLLSGGLTSRGEKLLARLASWMPFEPARELLEELVGVQVSKATARRATLATGTAALAVWGAEVERLKQEVPQAPDGVDKQAMSGDGAYVLLVGGEWVEVKTLTIGEVTRNKRGDGCTRRSPPVRVSRTPSALRRQCWAKRIGGGWNGRQRCARCKMERSGCRGWSTTTERRRYVSSTSPMLPHTSMRSGRPCKQQEADCRPPG